MAIQTNTQSVRVILWGEEIGRLIWNNKTNMSYFFFSPKYFELPYDISPILYPKTNQNSRFAIYGEKDDKAYQKLPPFLADSLPDRWGNLLFDDWFKKMNYHAKDKTPITKLSFIGNTAMGALEFLPEINKHYGKNEVNLSELYAAAKAFEEKMNGTFIADEEKTKDILTPLGTSPGGSRSKAIISQRSDGIYVLGKGATDPAYKHYILKFNEEIYSASETEMTYYQLAILSGIDMMPSKLIEIDGTKNFATERFDRQNGEKVYMQTLAGMNQCEETYENLFSTCRMLNLSVPEMEEMFRRTAFNFLMNNTDDHRKNFSFLMEKNGQWRISPAYDLTFILETGNTPCETHCMSLNGKTSDVTYNDLMQFAKNNGIADADRIIDRIITASMLFKDLATKNGIRSDMQEIIDKQLTKLRPEQYTKINITTGIDFKSKTGKKVENAHFERSEKGNIHLVATINGQEQKNVLTPKREEYRNIITWGFNNMKPELKKNLFEELLLKTRKNQLCKGR